MSFWNVLTLIGLTMGCLLASRSLIHIFQLESYQFPGWFRSLKRNQIRTVLPGVLMEGIWLLLMILTGICTLPAFWNCILAFVWMTGGGYAIRHLLKRKKEKKPLALTPRVKRLYAVSFVFNMLILLLLRGWVVSSTGNVAVILLSCFPLFLPVWVGISGLLAWPVEKAISEMYFQDARKKLDARPDLIRIGITGSWGKTSVKFILGTLLEEKYHTLITPASFNTPMGVTKIIRTKLEPSHRVFVSEMGARHVGDIREMCRLVRPEIGIITSVGPQHLDTFKTVERVVKTKYELMEALPEQGVCFFGDDGGLCRGLYEKTTKKKILAGFDPAACDVHAENITVSPSGSRFDLVSGDTRIPCETKLLGRLNIGNIVLAASVCLELGLTSRQIASGIMKLQPVEHRLQLISRPGCMTVIDDAFNSNIRGAKQALEVLKAFPARRIVITPGMVELGNEENKLNRELGAFMAKCVDIAILVGGKHTAPIAEGLRKEGFAENNLYIVRSLQEATTLLNTFALPEDTVLYENDLPDNYSE